MKLVVFTLSMLLASSVSAFERNLQMCPVPDGSPCTTDSAPVKCGSMNCEYGNQCTANAAGFSPGVCWPATCTAPDPNTPCTADSNPVLCGDSACPYANYCNAEAAGFPPIVCAAENCPVPAGDTICPAISDPHVCLVEGTGLCRYASECLANSAGLSPELGQCLRTDEYVNNVLGSCPPVSGETICQLTYEPIRCGECYYANECEAASAGYDTTDALTCQSAYCAKPDTGIACTSDFTPVTCFDGCVYSNQCTANAAGYWDNGCVDFSCPAPDPMTQCTREYDPQVCTTDDGAKCTYDNLCVANSAGQFLCESELDPVNPSECPVPDATSPCTLEIDEKICGPNDCFYTNQCSATAAGYTEVECRNINCPGSSDDILADCGDFSVDAVLCGPYNCPYISSCVANRAGWSPPVECTPQACPLPSAGTACTLEYQPTICASSAVANGVPCPYSNGCQAAAAGYDTTATSGQCFSPLLPTRSVYKADDAPNVTTTSTNAPDEHNHTDPEHVHDNDDTLGSGAAFCSVLLSMASIMVGLVSM